MSRNKRRRRTNSGGSTANRTGRTTPDHSGEAVVLRPSTETKSSLKTTELLAYAAAVLAVVMTALAVDGDAEGHGDPFGAEDSIRFITYLTIGYLVARGLAKSGSHERRVERGTVAVDDDARTTAPAPAPADGAADRRDDEPTEPSTRDADSDEDAGSDEETVDTDATPSDDPQHRTTP